MPLNRIQLENMHILAGNGKRLIKAMVAFLPGRELDGRLSIAAKHAFSIIEFSCQSLTKAYCDQDYSEDHLATLETIAKTLPTLFADIETHAVSSTAAIKTKMNKLIDKIDKFPKEMDLYELIEAHKKSKNNYITAELLLNQMKSKLETFQDSLSEIAKLTAENRYLIAQSNVQTISANCVMLSNLRKIAKAQKGAEQPVVGTVSQGKIIAEVSAACLNTVKDERRNFNSFKS